MCTAVTDEYDLDLGAKTQLSVYIYDLLFTTYHLMAVSDVHFPTVQYQHQLSTLRKMMTSTSARLGTLAESFRYMRSNDALKWKDIKLYMVKHPEDPACQVLLMRITHSLNKIHSSINCFGVRPHQFLELCQTSSPPSIARNTLIVSEPTFKVAAK